jgi:hypothetical protein
MLAWLILHGPASVAGGFTPFLCARMARRGRLDIEEVDEAGHIPDRHGSHRGWRQGGRSWWWCLGGAYVRR